ncbi:uncharacterized protein LOC142520354 [Primulina tabacum]|uniref:uncharacterized protein LOC142520354 n=1 Tax=Primulina tabacum TaxID=48773 RepID=UPI003F59B08F
MIEEENGELMPKESVQKEEHALAMTKESVIIKADHPNKPKQVILEKPTPAMTKNIRPLYIKAHLNGKPVSRVLIDNGSAVNVLPIKMLKSLSKTEEDLIPTEVSVAALTRETTKTIGVFPADVYLSSLCAFFVVNSSAKFQALLGRDWIHANQCIPSSMHQLLLFWKRDDVEVVETDGQPFKTSASAVVARYYNGDFGPIKIRSNSKRENPLYMKTPTPSSVLERILKPTVIVPPRLKAHVQQVLNKLEEEEAWDTYGTEVVQDEKYEDDELQVDELLIAPSQMEDGQHEVKDPLEEINLGELEDPKVVYVSKLLEDQLKQDLISMLKEYKNYFAWSYDDMPGLDKKLVEHRLSLKDGFNPFQQPSRRMSKEVELKVKQEVEKLLRAKFIKPIRYTEWLLNIVPVMKKNGKIRIFIDFRDLNCATPKDVLQSDQNSRGKYSQNNIQMPMSCWYGMPLKLYISTAHESIRCLLVQNNHEGNEQAIYYLSRFLTPVEVKYSVIEKLCLTLYYACTKLRHYLIQSRVLVVTKTDLIKYMLNRPILSGRIGKWSLALAEFTLTYYPQKSVKGQAIADFLADHPSLDEFIGEQVGFPVCGVEVRPWELKFDGSSTDTAAGAGLVITSPRGVKIAVSFNLGFSCTNNQAEYEALVIGLEILKDLGGKELLISGDSQLVLKQISGEFKCTNL